MIVLHCALEKEWSAASKTGTYSTITSSSNSSNPIISCADPAKITVENFSFPTIQSYVILCIDTNLVKSEAENTEIGYNIHGSLNTDAVVATLEYTFDGDDKFILTSEIKDIAIINKVLESFDINYTSHRYFRDGTYSRIILLNEKYIIKQNEPKLLESEVLFSEKNPSEKLQHILYADEEFKFIVYNFIPGDVMHYIEDVNDLFDNIKEITSNYSDYDGDEFGYIYMPSTSWTEFFKNMAHNQSRVLPESFDYLPKVYEAISTLEKYPFKKKLIHGDFGAHNFIKLNGKFVGAIDPIPVAGDPLYDLVYAAVSNVDLIGHVSADSLAKLSGEPIEKVKAMLIVVLYYRLSICLRHHKEDFDSYVDFWYKVIE